MGAACSRQPKLSYEYLEYESCFLRLASGDSPFFLQFSERLSIADRDGLVNRLSERFAMQIYSHGLLVTNNHDDNLVPLYEIRLGVPVFLRQTTVFALGQVVGARM